MAAFTQAVLVGFLLSMSFIITDIGINIEKIAKSMEKQISCPNGASGQTK